MEIEVANYINSDLDALRSGITLMQRANFVYLGLFKFLAGETGQQ